MENKLDFKAYVLDIEYSPSNVMQGMAQPSEQLIQLKASHDLFPRTIPKIEKGPAQHAEHGAAF